MGKEFEKEQKKKIDYLKNVEYLNRQDSMDEPHNIFTHTHTHTHTSPGAIHRHNYKEREKSHI